MGIHGRQHTARDARIHWINRVIDRITPEAGDRLILFLALFAMGLIVGMLLK